MVRVSRSAVAAVLAATVALGAVAPAVAAAPKASHGQSDHVVKAKSSPQAKKAKPVKAAASKASRVGRADRSLTPRQRRLVKQAARKSAFLNRVAGLPKVDRLNEIVRTSLLLNISDDRTRLADLREAVAGSTGADLGTLLAETRAIRPERYHTIINQLRLALRLVEPAAGLPEAADLDALIQSLLTYDAVTSRADLRSGQRTLAAVREAVEAAEEASTGEETGTGEDTGLETASADIAT